MFTPVSFEELLTMTGGYGVAKLHIPEGHALINKMILESELRKNDITILVIIRGDNTMPNPTADTKIEQDDRLLLFGKLDNIRSQNGE